LEEEEVHKSVEYNTIRKYRKIDIYLYSPNFKKKKPSKAIFRRCDDLLTK
jgi:hypothetical protein